jgi:hypothetical protein
MSTETIKHANLASFTCLKAFAFDERNERKDAHDLVYCIEYSHGGIETAAEAFRGEVVGKHGAVVRNALDVLRRRFAEDAQTEGYRKDGPVAVAKFELGDGEQHNSQCDARILRQRAVTQLIDSFLKKIHASSE